MKGLTYMPSYMEMDGEVVDKLVITSENIDEVQNILEVVQYGGYIGKGDDLYKVEKVVKPYIVVHLYGHFKSLEVKSDETV